MNTLTTLIILGAILALWHYLYESILVPEMKHTISFKLFQIAENLQDDELNLALRKQLIDTMETIKTNKLKLSKQELFQLFKHNNQAYTKTEKQINYLIFKAKIIQFGGWLPYILPFLPIFYLYNKVKK